MKVFVTGSEGQLGYDIMRELSRSNHICIGADLFEKTHNNYPYIQLDIIDPIAVNRIISSFNPDVVIHCAAWTEVDAAEEPNNLQIVKSINTEGTRNIVNICKKLNCKMIYISTDYVFDGHGSEPWLPDCHQYHPLNIYGHSKLAGELIVASMLHKYYILRVEWMYGINGKNFVKTIINIGNKYDEVKVVYDQIGTPTYTVDISKLIIDMAEKERYGYYHAANEGGFISWYEFTSEIFRQTGITSKIVPVSTKEYGRSKANRPLNSRFDKSKLQENGFKLLPTWSDALTRFLKEMGY